MRITIVGLGMDMRNLPKKHQAVIDSAKVLVGGLRQLGSFKDHPGHTIAIQAPLEDVIKAMRVAGEKDEVVVLADGDPLLFGIGNRLAKEFADEDIRVLPNVSALQTAAARLKIPVQDIEVVSLHGRGNYVPLFDALMTGNWVAVYTDSGKGPMEIAGALLDRGVEA